MKKYSVMPKGVCRDYKTLEYEVKRIDKETDKVMKKILAKGSKQENDFYIFRLKELLAASHALNFARGVMVEPI